MVLRKKMKIFYNAVLFVINPVLPYIRIGRKSPTKVELICKSRIKAKKCTLSCFVNFRNCGISEERFSNLEFDGIRRSCRFSSNFSFIVWEECMRIVISQLPFYFGYVLSWEFLFFSLDGVGIKGSDV